jgi:hypothetical protein
MRADNWYTRTADNCRIPEVLPSFCDGCICYAYCHRQLTLDDIQEKEEEK